MIVDVHAHVSDDDLIADRASFAARDAWFALQNPPGSRRLSSLSRLRRTMVQHGVDHAWGLGFGWRDHGLCVARNDLAIASNHETHSSLPSDANEPVESSEFSPRTGSRGRGWEPEVAGPAPLTENGSHPIVTRFGVISPAAGVAAVREIERVARAGLGGIGELFPDGQGFDIGDRAVMGPVLIACEVSALPLVIHCSESIGREYPTRGTTTVDRVLALIDLAAEVAPDALVVLAHLGGGLPLLAHVRGIRGRLERTRVCFDTAACVHLYDPSALTAAVAACPSRIHFGSDHPVAGIGATRAWIEAGSLSPDAYASVMCGPSRLARPTE